jgi:hypothetical protein
MNPSQPANLPSSPAAMPGTMMASALQMAILNNMLPNGFKFELVENAWKVDSTEKKLGKRQKTVFRAYDFVGTQKK